ncbi:MAG: mono/diheme cytochrome c family protein [Verrucomicrobiales bacterium]|jgi:mono/diheme cytochrome c family protein
MSAPDPNQPVHSDYDEKVSVVSEHAAAAAREKPDPLEGTEPVSLWCFLLAGIALIVGAGYLGATNGGFSNSGFTYVEGLSIPDAPTKKGAIARPPGEQWIRDGKKQFSAICAACHQNDGKGQVGVFPPLAGSEWVVDGSEQLAMTILNGMQGPITVSGAGYNSLMAPWKDALNDKQIAQVMSYIRISWGNADLLMEGDNGFVSEEMAAYARKTHNIPNMNVSHLAGFDKNLPGPQLDPVTLETLGEGGAAAPDATPAE